ncbi:MAG: hypothetical protein WBG17_14325, partial [Burkholderiaceae bacterium]
GRSSVGGRSGRRFGRGGGRSFSGRSGRRRFFFFAAGSQSNGQQGGDQQSLFHESSLVMFKFCEEYLPVVIVLGTFSSCWSHQCGNAIKRKLSSQRL